jgi:hypothetical protein
VPMPKIVLLFKIQFSNKNSKLWNLQSDIKVIHKIGQTQHQKPLFTLSFMLSFLPLCCTEKTMFRHLTSTLAPWLSSLISMLISTPKVLYQFLTHVLPYKIWCLIALPLHSHKFFIMV